MEKSSQAWSWKKAKEFIVITVGTIIVAAAVFFFLIPSHLSIGSISGLAIILSNFIPASVSAITMAMNIVCLAVGFLLVGREFCTRTIYTSLLLPAALGVLEKLFPNNQSLMGDPFLDMVCYCGLVSVGVAMLFTNNSSSGGLDIVAKILNKYLRMDLGKAMSAAGICIALSSAVVYDAKTVVLSVLGTYLSGVVVDHFIFGLDAKKRVCVITEKSEELRQYILHELHSGATLYWATGAYDLERHQEIVTIVDKHEYTRLMNFISQLDKDAFITVYAVNEIHYRPKVIPPPQKS